MIERIPNHVEQGLDRLIEQFRGLPDMEAWCSSTLEEVQLLEDAIWSFIDAFDVDRAPADLLKKIGKIVGQTWAGEELESYRLTVKARIAVNRSNGQWADLNRVARLFFETYAWQVTPPMNLILRVEAGERPGTQQALLEEAAQATTRIDIVYSSDAPADRFAFGPEGAGFQDGGLSGRASSTEAP